MTDGEILRELEAIARRHLGHAGRLAPEQLLVEDLGLDSLRALTLVLEVENRFQVCLEPDVEAQVVTVGDLVAAVRRAREHAA